MLHVRATEDSWLENHNPGSFILHVPVDRRVTGAIGDNSLDVAWTTVKEYAVCFPYLFPCSVPQHIRLMWQPSTLY